MRYSSGQLLRVAVTRSHRASVVEEQRPGRGRCCSQGCTEPGRLTTGGVYRFSRNPQYAGFVIAGVGGAVARRSAFAAALAAGYAGICTWWVSVKEQNLERRFGVEYVAFRAGTPRWLGSRRT